MRELTEEEFKLIISDGIADYSKDIYLFVPLNADQPVVMYTSLIRGIPDKHSLSHELRLKYSGGMYFYKTKQKPFDITKHEWSCVSVDGVFVYDCGDIDIEFNPNINTGQVSINKKDAIAIASHFGLTAEDLA